MPGRGGSIRPAPRAAPPRRARSFAAARFERAVSCDPDYALGYKNLAAMELERGNAAAAADALRKAVRASGGDPELRRLLDEVVAYERSRR